MRDLDGRASFAGACGVASLLVFLNPAAGIFFGLIGTVFAGASVISVDESPTGRTRRVALVAGVVCVATFVVGLIIAASIPQN